MDRDFSATLAALRKRKGLSQRTAAADLRISQALLSHYENGAREPGLAFLVRACDYYGVSADYLLGRSEEESKTESPWTETTALAADNVISALRTSDNLELRSAAERYICAAMLIVLEHITRDKNARCLESLHAELALAEVHLSLVSARLYGDSKEDCPPAGIECQRLMAGLKALINETAQMEY